MEQKWKVWYTCHTKIAQQTTYNYHFGNVNTVGREIGVTLKGHELAPTMNATNMLTSKLARNVNSLVVDGILKVQTLEVMLVAGTTE